MENICELEIVPHTRFVKLKTCRRNTATDVNMRGEKKTRLLWGALKGSKEKHILFLTFILLSCFLSRYKCLWSFLRYLPTKQASSSLPFCPPSWTWKRGRNECVLSPLLFTLNLGWDSHRDPDDRAVEWRTWAPSGPALALPSLWEFLRIPAQLWSGLLVIRHVEINFLHRLFIQRERCIFETIERVFVKLKLNPFFLWFILATFPKQGITEGINLKFGLPQKGKGPWAAFLQMTCTILIHCNLFGCSREIGWTLNPLPTFLRR